MDDLREKVILGIENCIKTDSVTECRKTECPFIACRESCLEWLLRSALSLLKEQEERIKKFELERSWDKNPETMGKRKSGMNEREQVISNLLYMKHDCLEGSDTDKTLDRAIALLKAQGPRMMTLEEVHEMAWDYCYLEEEVIKDKVLQIYSGKHRVKCITWPSVASCVLTFGNDAYGKRWRCWTSRPTDEQREAVKWE